MRYISTPLTFQRTEHGVTIRRDIEDRFSMMDNLVELVAFTPHGNFNADPDFGLEYWNDEYSNVNDTQFNNNDTGMDEYEQSTKQRCEASIANDLLAYAPNKIKLREPINVTMNLKDCLRQNRKDRVNSHHEVVIFVEAKMDDGMGTTCDYNREVSFMVEPTARKPKVK